MTPSPIRTLIVDDEPLARNTIRLLLEADPDVLVVGECGDGAEAARAIRELAPDLLFLDVQMPEMDGFQVLRAVPDQQWPVTIFVTAYDRYALRAFEVHALDYLLKPFDDDRFDHALRRAKAGIRSSQIGAMSRRLVALLDGDDAAGSAATARHPTEAPAERPAAPEPANLGSGERYLTRLAIRSGGRIVFLGVDEIDWIEAADYYVRLHSGERSHLLRETMRGLERRLDPARFFRVHRSAIVNLDRVKELQPWFHGRYLVILEDGTQLRLSRRRRERLESLLGGRI